MKHTFVEIAIYQLFSGVSYSTVTVVLYIGIMKV